MRNKTMYENQASAVHEPVNAQGCVIKNLSQLKKKLTKGTDFVITAHCRPEVIGEHRRINYIDTTGFYSIKPSELDTKVSIVNGGKGSYLGWSKASFWDFGEDGVFTLYSNNTNKTNETLIIAIRVLD